MKEILFTGKIPITSSNEDIPWQMKCDITRTDDLVEIRLIDTRDIFTFFVCNLSQSDFYVLKQEQDLIVDYDSFIPILVKLFHGILINRLFALFSKETTKFMFVEKSEFRNIVRLELKFLKPDENNFKRYLSDIIERMESDNIKLIKENGMLNSQCINGDKQMKDRINYLEKENKKQNLTISILTKDKDKLTNDNYNKGIEIKELKNKILTLEKDNSNLSYDLEKAKLEIVKYKNTLERNQEIEIELKDLKKEIETANEIIKEIREENKNLKIKNDKNEEGDKNIKNENKRLRNEGEDLKKRIKVLEEKSKKTKEDLKKKEEDLKTLEKENQNLIRKLENAQSVYNHFYNKNVERNSFSEESSGYSIHPESPP